MQVQVHGFVVGSVLAGVLLGACTVTIADEVPRPSPSGSSDQVRIGSPDVSVASIDVGFESAALPQDCPEADFAGGSGPDYAVEAIRAYAQLHETTYAGLWGYDGGFRVAFTDELGEHAEGLRAAVGGDVRIEVVRARWTLRQLNEVSDEIVERMDQEVAGKSFSAVGVSENLNRVGVMLEAVNDEVRQALVEQYPADMLCLQQGVLRPVDA